MNKISCIFLLTAITFSCSEPNKVKEVKKVGYESVSVIKFTDLEPRLTPKDSKVHIINFFASWCRPCIQELPYFEKISEKYRTKNVDVLLVSLDFKEDLETKLKPLLRRMNVQSRVVLLDEVDYNKWLPQVDENWDGALPYTLIIKEKISKKFYGSVTADSLEAYISPNL